MDRVALELAVFNRPGDFPLRLSAPGDFARLRVFCSVAPRSWLPSSELLSRDLDLMRLRALLESVPVLASGGPDDLDRLRVVRRSLLSSSGPRERDLDRSLVPLVDLLPSLSSAPLLLDRLLVVDDAAALSSSNRPLLRPRRFVEESLRSRLDSLLTSSSGGNVSSKRSSSKSKSRSWL